MRYILALFVAMMAATFSVSASASVTTTSAQQGNISVDAVTGDAYFSVFVYAATVPAGTPNPTGTIQLLDDHGNVVSSKGIDLSYLLTCGIVNPNPPAYCANAIAGESFSLATLAPGSYTYTAVYSGDTYYSPSTSPAFTVVVPARPQTKVATTSAQQGNIFVNAVTGDVGFSILVYATAVPSGTPNPTGTIQLLDNHSNVVGSLNIGNSYMLANGCGLPNAPAYCANAIGGQVFNLAALAPGSYTYTAVYSGDTYYSPSTSPAFTVVVPARPQTKVATTSAQQGNLYVNAVTGDVGFSILVYATAVPSGTPNPTGTIQLLDNHGNVVSSLNIGNSYMLANGCGLPNAPAYCANAIGGQVFNLAALTPGSYTYTAVYSGDAHYSPSTSGAFSFIVPDRGPINTPAISFNGPTATHSGNVLVTMSGGGPICGFTSGSFVPTTGSPDSPSSAPPAGTDFSHGLIKFQTSGCTPGSTLTFTLTFPPSSKPIQSYWKFGKTPGNTTPHWYQIPATINGTQVQFSVTDGGLGDDDLTVNGTIVDPGGPVLAAAAPADAQPAPALRGLGMLILMLTLILTGYRFVMPTHLQGKTVPRKI